MNLLRRHFRGKTLEIRSKMFGDNKNVIMFEGPKMGVSQTSTTGGKMGRKWA